jgi:hypothetical protein
MYQRALGNRLTGSRPADLKKEISDLLEFLKQKRKARRKIKERKPGAARD